MKNLIIYIFQIIYNDPYNTGVQANAKGLSPCCSCVAVSTASYAHCSSGIFFGKLLDVRMHLPTYGVIYVYMAKVEYESPPSLLLQLIFYDWRGISFSRLVLV